jgi:phage-related protein
VKDVQFHPEAIAAIREFPASVRQHLGKALYDLQLGESLSMPLSRPIPGIASGAAELRLRDASGAFRVFYIAKVGASILVFHAFTKKTQKTPARELTLAQKRLKEMTP